MQIATPVPRSHTFAQTALPRCEVIIAADDPVSRAGIEMQLRGERSIHIAERGSAGDDAVAIVVAEAMDDDAVSLMRNLRREGVTRILLVVSRLDDTGMLAAAENGVSGVLRRSDVSTRTLVSTIDTVASGDGALPADLLARLLDQVGRLQRRVLSPRGLTFSGMTEREIAVLTLLAEGHDTSEVGRRLFYSERTVKNIVHDVTSRFDLRNRTHAVAFAIREGYI